MSERQVILTLREDAGDLELTRAELEREGLVVETVLPMTKLIIGRAPSERLAGLQANSKVLSLREERGINLPPLHPKVPQ